MMAAFLDAAQINRIGILIADHEPDNLGVEVAAGREILRGQYQMACSGDVERRVKIGLRDHHVSTCLVGSDTSTLPLPIVTEAIRMVQPGRGAAGVAASPIGDMLICDQPCSPHGAKAECGVTGIPDCASALARVGFIRATKHLPGD